MDSVDCIVIGAGVVGLAAARALALAGREVIVLEGAEGIGTGTSSRNSEVIHAGIYYKAGSLKARLCIAGRKALYAYCAEHGVAANRCGKLIVATNAAENGQLAAIRARAEANGVDDMREVTGAADYELRIVTRDMHAFDDFLREKILSLGLVSNIESRIVIRAVKNSTAVPLGLISPYVGVRA